MDTLSNTNTPNKNVLLDKIQILNLFKILDNLPFEPKSDKEIWYIVNKEFIDNLRYYECGKSDSYSNIINNKIFLEDYNNVNTKSRIVKEYENSNGVGFLLYPEKAIEILEKHFIFDVKIPRAVYAYKTNRKEKIIYKVDIQPLKIVVYSKNPNEHSNPSKMKIVILRNDTVENVLKEIVGTVDSATFRKNLFYSDELDNKREKNWKGLYIFNCIEYALSKKVCEFSIDENSCLLITSERPDIKCIMNRSNNNVSYSKKEGHNRRMEIHSGLKNNNNDDDEENDYYDDNNNNNNNNSMSEIEKRSISYIFDKGGDRGLINLGNTCFLNSSLQCLSKILKFSNYFLSGSFWNHINYSNPVGQHGRLAKAYYETLTEMWKINKRDCPYAPKVLKEAISEKRDEFYGYQQHDSQELLAFLLDGLHEDLNLIRKKPYYEEKLQGGVDKLDVDVAEASWNRHKEINNSIIVDLFQGQYRSRLQCPKCKKVSITFDPFMYLSIPLPPKKNHRVWFHVILSRDIPIAIRFSCTFNGSQEVLKLKIFFLNIIKNMKNKKRNILLHSKSIIKNNKYPHEGSNAFNFHSKFLDDNKNDLYDENEYNNNNNNNNNINSNNINDDVSNYIKALKNKSKITNTLKEQDIQIIYESICSMCNISSIDELEVNNLCFLYTKLKNLACNNFFQVLNNSDFVTEPHTRNGKGISHIFVYILPKIFGHLIDKNIDLKVDECLEVLTNSTVTTNNTSLKDEEDINIRTETNDKKTVKNKHCTNKIVKKRKGLLSNPLRKGTLGPDHQKYYQEDDVEENIENTNEINIQQQQEDNKIINNNHNDNIKKNSNEYISYNDLLNDQAFLNDNYHYLNDKYFSVLIVPLCKDEQLLYKMKNNDLPLLYNIPFNYTLEELYNKVKYSYNKNNHIKASIMKMNSCLKMEKNDMSNSLYHKNKNIESPKKDNTLNGTGHNIDIYQNDDNNNMNVNGCKGIDTCYNLDDKININGNDISNKYANSMLNEYNNNNNNNNNNNSNNNIVNDEEDNSYDDFLDKFSLYLPCYNLKEEWNPKDNLGLELKRDGTYLSDYIKNSEEKRLIIIYLNTVGMEDELSLDIKTLTFVDLEEKYGIDTCLKLFSEEEHLDENNTWYCSNCKLHVQAYKKLDLFRMPIILILHLKRFNNTNRWLRTKIDSYVYYPHKEKEYLNMAPYILPDGLKHMTKLNPKYAPLYELIGVNCHTGSLCGGHYFAYVKLNDQWYNFNDSCVSTIDEAEVNTKNAYLLFYQLISHKNEKFSGYAQTRNLDEQQAILMANASYYN
ncbi:ubiquitin carboxyl-terminal hydrolase 2, putative [Plasmodium gaboni]|uniref:Ubiquitin carboxyl-terminal hydrolase 2, putative n=1 Tax=Plasmodium gaboni TaxID=647221 RepID=A0ABY1UIP3_9APIC|nr:ubiquitin carboxyl-terminal hydrolase 2, putative [Plasmodium gaboni]